MTNTDTQTVLIQDIESFKTLGIMGHVDGLDKWLSSNSYGIVSLDRDADGQYDWVALVAPQDGPDFIMDNVTGEMEPVEDIDPAAELEAKMDIALELDMNDVPQEQILAMIAGEAAPEPAPAKPRKNRKTSKKVKTVKKAKSNKGAKMRNFEILASFIESNPGVSRTDVFADAGLQSTLRNKGQRLLLAKGDKLETKRWNRRLNFLIREMRRQGVEIEIERKGRVAHYTIGTPSGQLELPFTPAAEARNATIIGDDANVVTDKPAFDTKRATEDPNQMMDFEALLATLDEEAVAPVTK